MWVLNKNIFKTPEDRIAYIKCQISFIRVSLVDNCKSKNDAKKKNKWHKKRSRNRQTVQTTHIYGWVMYLIVHSITVLTFKDY